MKDVLSLIQDSQRDVFSHVGLTYPSRITLDDIKQRLVKTHHHALLHFLINEALGYGNMELYSTFIIKYSSLYLHYLIKNNEKYRCLDEHDIEALKVFTYFPYSTEQDKNLCPEMYAMAVQAYQRRYNNFKKLYQYLFKKIGIYEEYRNNVTGKDLRDMIDSNAQYGGASSISYSLSIICNIFYDRGGVPDGFPTIDSTLNFFFNEDNLKKVGWTWKDVLYIREVAHLDHHIFREGELPPEHYIASMMSRYGLPYPKAEEIANSTGHKINKELYLK